MCSMSRFIEEHTSSFQEFAEFCRAQDWANLEAKSGLSRTDMENAAAIYMRSNAVIANYGMGITQQKRGVETVKMVVNLLLLRGNIGKPGTGISQSAAIRTFKGNALLVSRKKPSWFRSTDWRNFTTSTRREQTGRRRSMRAKGF